MQIKFNNVVFSYDEKAPYLLDNISFDLEKNDFIALTGRAGSGKTTIIDLINFF